MTRENKLHNVAFSWVEKRLIMILMIMITDDDDKLQWVCIEKAKTVTKLKALALIPKW